MAAQAAGVARRRRASSDGGKDASGGDHATDPSLFLPAKLAKERREFFETAAPSEEQLSEWLDHLDGDNLKVGGDLQVPHQELERRIRAEWQNRGVAGMQEYSLHSGMPEHLRHRIHEVIASDAERDAPLAQRQRSEVPTSRRTPAVEHPDEAVPPTPGWVRFATTITDTAPLMLQLGALSSFIQFSLSEDYSALFVGIAAWLGATVVPLADACAVPTPQRRGDEERRQRYERSREDPRVHATVLTPDGSGGSEAREIATHLLVRGDVLRLKAGELVPADVRLLAVNHWQERLMIDESCTQGASRAVEAHTELELEGPHAATRTGWGRNVCLGEATVASGSATAVVIRPREASALGRVERLAMQTQAVVKPLRHAELLQLYVQMGAVALSLALAMVHILWAGPTSGPDGTMFAALSYAMIAGAMLAIQVATSSCLARQTRRALRLARLVATHTNAVDAAGLVTTVCVDKTGTLTQNRPAVKCVLCDNRAFPSSPGFDATSPTAVELLRAMSLATAARFDKRDVEETTFLAGNGDADVNWTAHGDPVDRALIVYAQFMECAKDKSGSAWSSRGGDMVAAVREQFPCVAQVPFTSEHQRSFNVVSLPGPGSVHTVYSKGSLEMVLQCCTRIMLHGEAVELTPERRDIILGLAAEPLREGNTMVALAMQRLPVDAFPAGFLFRTDAEARAHFPWGEPADTDGDRAVRGFTFLGAAALYDPPRPEAARAILDCRAMGVRTIMVTGDHPKPAIVAARQSGIVSRGSLTAEEIARCNRAEGLERGDSEWLDPAAANTIVQTGVDDLDSDAAWAHVLQHPEIVFARCRPHDKLRIARKLLALQDEAVAFVGDGANDALALRAADVGISLAGAHRAAVNCADVVCLDRDRPLTGLATCLAYGEHVYSTVGKMLTVSLSCAVALLAPAIVASILAAPAPLSIPVLLTFQLGPALVLPASLAFCDPERVSSLPTPGRGIHPNRPTRNAVVHAVLVVGVWQALAGLFAWTVVLSHYGYPPHLLGSRLAAHGNNWGEQVLYCTTVDGTFRDATGAGSSSEYLEEGGFVFWDPGAHGTITDCVFAAKSFVGRARGGDAAVLNATVPSTFANATLGMFYTADTPVVTKQAIEGIRNDGYVPYIPWRAHGAPFWDDRWMSWTPSDASGDVSGSGQDVLSERRAFASQPFGVWDAIIDSTDAEQELGEIELAIGSALARDAYATVAGTSAMATRAAFAQHGHDAWTFGHSRIVSGVVRTNIASRMVQKHALRHAQTAYAVAVLAVGIAHCLCRRTRWVSCLRGAHSNWDVLLLAGGVALAVGASTIQVGFARIRFADWLVGMPFALLLVVGDEARKAALRAAHARGDPHSWVLRYAYV